MVTYGEAFAVQPFGNIMQTITLTGAAAGRRARAAVEPAARRSPADLLEPEVHPDPGHALGNKVSDITIDGTLVAPATGYRVSVNNFLAAGGDGFTGFTQGTDPGGPVDLDAFTAYLTAHSPVSPPPLDRIVIA